ncbi:hypothetical protein CC78DRAFT_573184 [Lojkania enalia]|uniref:Uncharacterized protein n=1 Tax=Lojkania enalia TaxID=147567 RepID=A0A9P4NCT0_9PLEO|nr:hypothetical protein CC78DRAFT_573184 [Didymosphaeria enalia]
MPQRICADHIAIRRNFRISMVGYLDIFISDTVEVKIKAVIGDTLLSGLAWVISSPLTNMDLYDSCLVVIAIDGKSIIVPSARVLSGHVKEIREPKANVEERVPREFIPKGGPNDAVDMGWVFWIPIHLDK